MKRILIGATVGIALLGVVALPVLAAVSGAGKDNLSPNTTVATQKPKFSAPVYDVSYTDPFFGPVRCTGVHLTFVHPAAANTINVLGNDTFMCTSTSDGPLTGVHSGDTLSLGTIGGWISDYYNLKGRTVYAKSFTGIVWSPDGYSYTATAVY